MDENNPDLQKLSLRRVSISDTNLPKFDLPQPTKEKSPFGRYLSSLIEGSSNSLNKFENADSISDHLKNAHWSQQQNICPPGTNLNTTGQAVPILRKSATTGQALGGIDHQPSQNSSKPGTLQTFNTIPTEFADNGLTMNFSSRPSAMAAIPSIPAGIAQSDKKSTFFGGLTSLFSLDILNKPLDDLKDREANYRLIMSLER